MDVKPAPSGGCRTRAPRRPWQAIQTVATGRCSVSNCCFSRRFAAISSPALRQAAVRHWCATAGAELLQMVGRQAPLALFHQARQSSRRKAGCSGPPGRRSVGAAGASASVPARGGMRPCSRRSHAACSSAVVSAWSTAWSQARHNSSVQGIVQEATASSCSSRSSGMPPGFARPAPGRLRYCRWATLRPTADAGRDRVLASPLAPGLRPSAPWRVVMRRKYPGHEHARWLTSASMFSNSGKDAGQCSSRSRQPCASAAAKACCPWSTTLLLRFLLTKVLLQQLFQAVRWRSRQPALPGREHALGITGRYQHQGTGCHSRLDPNAAQAGQALLQQTTRRAPARGQHRSQALRAARPHASGHGSAACRASQASSARSNSARARRGRAHQYHASLCSGAVMAWCGQSWSGRASTCETPRQRKTALQLRSGEEQIAAVQAAVPGGPACRMLRSSPTIGTGAVQSSGGTGPWPSRSTTQLGRPACRPVGRPASSTNWRIPDRLCSGKSVRTTAGDTLLAQFGAASLRQNKAHTSSLRA